MELKYPLILYIGAIAVAVLFVFTMFSSKGYKKGSKKANSDILRKLPQYRGLMIRYGILKTAAVFFIIVSLLVSLYLTSRPTKVRTYSEEVSNRDIFICLDVSTSLDGLNIDLLEQVKDMISELHGERFGITIFNARSILVCPLTTDYDFLLDRLDVLEESIQAGTGVEYAYQVGDWNDYGYRFSGVLETSGSSYIGDGLATCLYAFPDLDEDPDRSRMIIFVTDNDLNGKPVVTIDEAAELCASKGVKVFALAPDGIIKDEINFKNAIESTGGGYFNTRNDRALQKMLAQVKKTDTNTTVTTEERVIDLPEIGIAVLTAAVALYIYCTWRIKV